MEYSLDNFTGNYSCLPDVVRRLTSPEAFMTFSEIYAYGCRMYNATIVDAQISISRRNLQKAVGLGRIKIERAIKELTSLNFLSASGDTREKRSYIINWEEIYYANSIMSKLSYDGFEAIRNECKCGKENVRPISRLESTQIEKICTAYEYEWSESGLILNKSAEINPDENASGLKMNESSKINPDCSNENDKSGLILNKTSKINPDCNNDNSESGLKMNKSAEINPDCNFIWVEKRHKITEDENGELVLNVFLDDAENILVKRIGISRVNLGCFSQSGLIFAQNSVKSGLKMAKTFKINPDFCEESEKRSKSTQILETGLKFDKSGLILNKNDPKNVQNQPRVNIYNIKEDVLTERSEVSNIGGKKNFSEKVEASKENSESLEIIELVDPLSPEEHYKQDKERVKDKVKASENIYRNKPFFKVEAVKKIINSLDACTKSPVKLFINNFWWGLYDWWTEAIEANLPADENGNVIRDEEANVYDVLRSMIPEEDMGRLVCQAWSETADQIECGFIECEEGKLDLKIKKLPDDFHPEFLIDWRKTVDVNKRSAFVISLEGFRNIEAKDATETTQPKTKEQKKAFNRTNRQFIAALHTMEDSQLTPIERAIKDFTAKFIKLDEFYHVTGYLNGNGASMMDNTLPGWLIKPWTATMSDYGITVQDFYDTINVPGGYKDGSSLTMMNTVFAYQQVKRCNEMNGFQSQITEETLRNALQDDI